MDLQVKISKSEEVSEPVEIKLIPYFFKNEMQDVVNLSEEFNKTLGALYELSQNPTMPNETLLVYYDVLINYFIARGFVPIEASLRSDAKDFYIYFENNPVKTVSDDGQRKIYCSKTFNIQGFLDEFDLFSFLVEDFKLMERSQYKNPKQSGSILNYSLSEFKKLHEYKEDMERIPQNLKFALQSGKFTQKDSDNRPEVAFELFEQLVKYMPGGIFWKRHHYDALERSEAFTKWQYDMEKRKEGRMMYKIPEHIENFLKLTGIDEQITGDISQEYYAIIRRNFAGEFLRFLGQPNYRVNLNSINIKDELCGLRSDLSQSGEVFKLRLIKHLYTKLYGLDIRVKNAGNLVDLFEVLGGQKSEILQKQANIFINRQKSINCGHLAIVHGLHLKDEESRKAALLDILLTWMKPLTDQQTLEVTINDKAITIPQDYIICNSCDLEMLCGHKCIEYLLFDDYDEAKELVGTFRQNDIKISRSHAFCNICGEMLTERDHFAIHSTDPQLDAEKKYSIFRMLFRNVLEFNVETTSIFNSYQLFKDMVVTIEPVVKQALTGRKEDSDYKDEKLEVSFIFVCAYFANLSGESFHFSSRDFYQKNKKIIDTFEKFMDKVNRAKEMIKPQFIINNKDAIQTLAYRLENNHIIGKEFKNCDVMEKLERMEHNGKVDLIPLYFDEKNLPDMRTAKLENLEWTQIKNILLAQAIKYQNVSSPVIEEYSEFKRKYAESNIHKFHEPNPCNVSRYVPFKDKKITDIKPSLEQKGWETEFNLFYRSRCPEAIKAKKEQIGHLFVEKNHEKRCKDCGISDKGTINTEFYAKYEQDFKQQYHFIYEKQPTVRIIKQKKKDKLDIEYDDVNLLKIAMWLEVAPIQIVNFCGFDHVDYEKVIDSSSEFSMESASNAKNTKEQNKQNHLTTYDIQEVILKKVIEQYKATEVIPSKHYKGSSLNIKQFNFIEKIDLDWGVFKSRLGRIEEAFVETIHSLGVRTENVVEIKKVNSLFKEILDSDENAFILCELFISFFFSDVVSQLISVNGKDQVSDALKQMIKRDELLSIYPKTDILSITTNAVKKGAKLDEETVEEITGEPDMPDGFESREEDEEEEGDSDIDVDLMNREDADDDDYQED